MANLEEYKKDAILFIEAGFIAINQADEDSALKLFKAAETLDPKNSLIKIGLGYLHLHKLELQEAIKKFEEVLKEDPKNEMAKAFLGIALSWTPKEGMKGEKLLEATSHSKEEDIKDLSEMAVDFVEKFIKKEPTPLEGKPKK